MRMPTPEDLASLGESELLDLLDTVSEEVKRRNGLRPATAGKAAVEVMKALEEIVRKG
jgi:hypothetical protein